jgi:hypothetical protein
MDANERRSVGEVRPRLTTALVTCLVALAVGSESAQACSCASREGPLSLKGEDAAVTARLLEVRRKGPGSDQATFRYKVRRVFKGRHEYGLHRGTRLAIESSIYGASCGLPRNRRRLYGLILYEHRGELRSGLCYVTTPRALRRAADRRSKSSGTAARVATRTSERCASPQRASS